MKFIRKIILFLILILLITTFIVGYKGYNKYKNALTTMPLKEKISVINSEKNYTKLDDLPKMYKDAVISVEDHRFYNHGAIDIISILRAIYVDITNARLIEGGSTITQQLAKNIYFTQEKTVSRKVAEMLMAFEIERNYSKDEILELYVNTSYFGDGYYNVKEAAKGYFKKEPKDMNNYECTLLAGIPNAPSIYAPTQNVELSKQRQRQVLKSMLKNKYITEEQKEDIELRSNI